jgi:protein associated with RNAse G/E
MTERGNQIRVNSRRFDGKLKRSWKAKLLSVEPGRIDAVGEFDAEVDHPELGLIRRGTISYEFFWPDRWYNIFRFHEPDGRLRCFYCNIIMPPEFDGHTIDYVDLDIDILVWPDGRCEVLDEEEFAANSLTYAFPANVVERARQTAGDLLDTIESGRFPVALIPEI